MTLCEVARPQSARPSLRWGDPAGEEVTAFRHLVARALEAEGLCVVSVTVETREMPMTVVATVQSEGRLAPAAACLWPCDVENCLSEVLDDAVQQLLERMGEAGYGPPCDEWVG